MVKKALSILLLLTAASCAQLVGPKASVQQTDYNFGNIEQGKIVTHSFVIVNNGGDILKITDVNASCGCTAAKPEKTELKPGESTNIKVDFNTAGKIGPQDKMVYVRTNEPNGKELVLKLTGIVLKIDDISKVEVSPRLIFPETQHDFGQVPEGKVVDYTFKFKNNGKSELLIKDVKTSCGCTAALVSSKKIAPGSEGTLRVELDTKNRAGKMSRNVSIDSNDPQEPTKILVIYADVTKEKP
jgi:LEA14-like dessication related protein